MKKRNLILTLGLALGLGLGAIAGLSANKEVKAAEASVVSTAKTYRFTMRNSFDPDQIYLHIWGSATPANNTQWGSFIELSDYSFNENGQKVFLFNTDVTDYTGCLITVNKDNGDEWKSGNITIGSDTAWYWSGDYGAAPSKWDVSNQTYYFYDYNNVATEGVKCYATMSNGDFTNVANKASAPAMTVVSGSSGQLYSVSLDPMFDQVTLVNVHTGADIVDGLFVNQNRGRVYSYGKQFESSDWTSLTSALADDWIFNFMHLRDIPVNIEDDDTGACKSTGNNYYALAKAAFLAYDDDVTTLIHNYGSHYDNARARLIAWGAACKETIDIVSSGDGYTISGRYIPTASTGFEANDTALIIVVASLATVAAFSAFFLLRKRKED